ncbi:MAG: tyrosine-type recombinase/integrase [Lachnospiraceae bacterium]
MCLDRREESVYRATNTQNRFRNYVKTSGIEHANYHALRHTFATRCVELGFEIKSLSEILGHSM